MKKWMILYFTLLVVYDTENKKKNRRIPAFHPTYAMANGDIRTFSVKIDPGCTLSSSYFTVIKHHNIDPGANPPNTDVYFYVVMGETPKFNRNSRC